MRRCFVFWVVAWLAWSIASPTPARGIGWKQQRAQEIAAKVWRNPCGGNVAVRWGMPPADVLPAVPTGIVEAWAERPCTVFFRIDRKQPWWRFCTMMIHEYGHLAGLDHSPNPESVMNAIPPPDSRCDERGRPYLRGNR